MKRLLTVIFTFYFFISSAGVVYSTHYCSGKSSKSVWGFNISKTKACKCKHSGKQHKKSCCKTTSEWQKAKNDAGKQIVSSIDVRPSVAPVDFSIDGYSLQPEKIFVVFPASHSPPDLKTPAFIRYRTLLI